MWRAKKLFSRKIAHFLYVSKCYITARKRVKQNACLSLTLFYLISKLEWKIILLKWITRIWCLTIFRQSVAKFLSHWGKIRFFAPPPPPRCNVDWKQTWLFCWQLTIYNFSDWFQHCNGGTGGTVPRKPYFLEWLNNFSTDCLKELNFQRFTTEQVFVPRHSNLVSTCNLTKSLREQSLTTLTRNLTR